MLCRRLGRLSLDGFGSLQLLYTLPRRLSTATRTTEQGDLQFSSWYYWGHRARSFKSLLHPFRLCSSSGHRVPPPHTPPKQHNDLYSVLGLSPKATQQQIKDQFYHLSMLYHPDRNRGSHSTHQRFSEITEAYSILGQHTLRRKYDKGLLHEYPHSPHHDPHPHKEHQTQATMTTGPKKIYDFDEFYRAHYGEALKWQREQTATRKAAAAEAARLETLSEPMHRLLIISVVMSVFLVGWLGTKVRDKLEKEGKSLL